MCWHVNTRRRKVLLLHRNKMLHGTHEASVGVDHLPREVWRALEGGERSSSKHPPKICIGILRSSMASEYCSVKGDLKLSGQKISCPDLLIYENKPVWMSHYFANFLCVFIKALFSTTSRHGLINSSPLLPKSIYLFAKLQLFLIRDYKSNSSSASIQLTGIDQKKNEISNQDLEVFLVNTDSDPMQITLVLISPHLLFPGFQWKLRNN